VATLLVVAAARRISHVLLLTLVAFVLAVGLDPAVQWLGKLRILRGWAVGIIFGGLVVFPALIAARQRPQPLAWPSSRVRGYPSCHRGHRLVADLARDTRQRGRRSRQSPGSRLAAERRSVGAEQQLRPVLASIRGGSMDFSARVDELQQRVAATKSAVHAAATESREQLRQRIDQAQQDAKDAQQRAQQRGDQTAERTRSKFAQMKADAAAKMDDIQAKIDKRTRQLDAKAAATDADWAEAEAADALDFADWAVDNAQLAMLDAIDARAHAKDLAKSTAS
jgi:hypothetical protein